MQLDQKALDEWKRLLDVTNTLIGELNDPGTEALAAVYCSRLEIERVAALKAQEAVGEAGEMPGSNGGFTMAVFRASDVPLGSKLYTAPPSLPTTAGGGE